MNIDLSTCSFPFRLYHMLEEAPKDGYEDVICWMPEGDGFVVHDRDKFVDRVMKTFFTHTKWKSFLRQLNLYSFERLSRRGPGRVSCYAHPFLIRGELEKCKHIQRTHPTSAAEGNKDAGTTNEIRKNKEAGGQTQQREKDTKKKTKKNSTSLFLQQEEQMKTITSPLVFPSDASFIGVKNTSDIFADSAATEKSSPISSQIILSKASGPAGSGDVDDTVIDTVDKIFTEEQDRLRYGRREQADFHRLPRGTTSSSTNARLKQPSQQSIPREALDCTKIKDDHDHEDGGTLREDATDETFEITYQDIEENSLEHASSLSPDPILDSGGINIRSYQNGYGQGSTAQQEERCTSDWQQKIRNGLFTPDIVEAIVSVFLGNQNESC